MAKKETKTLERTYVIPLRKEYLKVPRWQRTKKAVKAVKQFLQRHMKTEQVKLGKHLNEELWKHGLKNPPHHIKVTVLKDEEGLVRAELFGHKIETKKEEKKEGKRKEKKRRREERGKAPTKKNSRKRKKPKKRRKKA